MKVPPAQEPDEELQQAQFRKVEREGQQEKTNKLLLTNSDRLFLARYWLEHSSSSPPEAFLLKYYHPNENSTASAGVDQKLIDGDEKSSDQGHLPGSKDHAAARRSRDRVRAALPAEPGAKMTLNDLHSVHWFLWPIIWAYCKDKRKNDQLPADGVVAPRQKFYRPQENDDRTTTPLEMNNQSRVSLSTTPIRAYHLLNCLCTAKDPSQIRAIVKTAFSDYHDWHSHVGGKAGENSANASVGGRPSEEVLHDKYNGYGVLPTNASGVDENKHHLILPLPFDDRESSMSTGCYRPHQKVPLYREDDSDAFFPAENQEEFDHMAKVYQEFLPFLPDCVHTVAQLAIEQMEQNDALEHPRRQRNNAAWLRNVGVLVLVVGRYGKVEVLQDLVLHLLHAAAVPHPQLLRVPFRVAASQKTTRTGE
ncbi:unnamed protein product [Amoebophrya sp. A120]|nr:unnamed protein product [Amoebophrya sp. A120]|eukprot:GSA120T00001037001.1